MSHLLVFMGFCGGRLPRQDYAVATPFDAPFFKQGQEESLSLLRCTSFTHVRIYVQIRFVIQERFDQSAVYSAGQSLKGEDGSQSYLLDAALTLPATPPVEKECAPYRVIVSGGVAPLKSGLTK
jgi:hypothetical protein